MKLQPTIGGLSSLRLLFKTLLVALFVVGGSFAFGQFEAPDDSACEWDLSDLVDQDGLKGDDDNEIRFNSRWDSDDDPATAAEALTTITIPDATGTFTAGTGPSGTSSLDLTSTTRWAEDPVTWKLEANWAVDFPNEDHVPISYTFLVTNDATPHAAPTNVLAVRESQTNVYVEWTVTRVDGACADNFLVVATLDRELQTTGESCSRSSARRTAIVTIDDWATGANNVFTTDTDDTDTADINEILTSRLGASVSGLCFGETYNVTVTGRSGVDEDDGVTNTTNRGQASAEVEVDPGDFLDNKATTEY